MSKCQFKDEISETLLIPLYFRAKESRRGEKAILHDDVADKIVSELDYDFSKFDNAKMSEIGSVVRCWYLDNAVRNFVKTHINPVVVNIGCGLDARAQRTIGQESNANFYSIDLPDVIQLRSRLVEPYASEKYIRGSILETDWMDELRQRHPDRDFIFVIEGVLMYFDEKQVKSILENLASRFKGGEIWFDVCGSLTVKNSAKHDAVKNVSARFKWGLDDGREIENWNSSLKLLVHTSQGSYFRNRFPLPLMIVSMFPKLLHKFCSILGYRIE